MPARMNAGFSWNGITCSDPRFPVPRIAKTQNDTSSARAALSVLLALMLLAAGCGRPDQAPSTRAPAASTLPARTPAQAEVIVVGAGLSGLTAALDLGRAGVRVLVLDMASVFGGHAVMANGDLNIVGTPDQTARGIVDSPEIAYADMIKWGHTESLDWARYYAENSQKEIYPWLTSLGVVFEDVLKAPDNSVPRIHLTQGRGIGLVRPVYLECLKLSNIVFRWNVRVTRLTKTDSRITGVELLDVRNGETSAVVAHAVVLATGGFQSNLDMVREYWAAGLPFPENFLAGSGVNSIGAGHKVAHAAGAALVEMDRQMNLASGIRDPRYPHIRRGLNAGNRDAIWVNREGRRFINESTPPEVALASVVRQPDSTYWAVFDAVSRQSFRVSGSDWILFERIDKLILQNPDLVKVAPTLEELAQLTGLPADALRETVETFNRSVDSGRDRAFDRFGPGHGQAPPKIAHPPFYAAQFFPLTRKSMGGVSIDLGCRVFDTSGRIIPGLFAVGELTGSAGINGETGMSGMFLGPCIVTGRVVARTILQDQSIGAKSVPRILRPALEIRSGKADTQLCLACHNLPSLAAKSRRGYWHFERVHSRVVSSGMDCAACHSELSPTFLPEVHRLDPAGLAQSCVKCHSGED